MPDKKIFGGPAVLLDRDDINTDEIIPAKYLTEISKRALGPHLLEDLKLDGFDNQSDEFKSANVVITRSNFGCGSSREHAVWALEVNDINVVIASSFARIFRQNMFNCGILALELSRDDLDRIFMLNTNLQNCKEGATVIVSVDMEREVLCISTSITPTGTPHEFKFRLNDHDRKLVEAGGWLAYADKKF